ncbi:helix-turn-helix domain-containing protein [Streptomyces profundus]|uniref:helix-turn-helix domain-containing protein n=1 Tax=Streptomyces profundus TaxID=2867410 RepID=UPI001D16F91B|nr:helix-turn-helix transcriptional regulator [Streptomyces sp. MA3_2.13]UED86321.1 helix-turn-helix domain-containing protein [Streptomyces sp. MA3_2.13]
MPQKPKPLDDTASTRAWFGVELRNWRNTRGLSTVTLGRKVHLSGTSVERIEKAERSCNAELAALFDDVLEAGGALRRLWRRVEANADKRGADADNRRSEPTPPRKLSSVERRAFLATGGLAAVSPGVFAEMIQRLGRTELPKVVRPEDIDQVRAAARDHASWDHRHGGGGILRTAAFGQLAWAKGLLDISCPPRLRSELFTEVGHLAMVVGASAFDAHEHDDAASLLDYARQCAEQADNWHLRARALSLRSRQMIWRGSPDQGLTYAEMGLIRADRLTHRERAMLHNARARALGKLGDRQQTLTAIGRSDDIFGHAREDEDAPWMAYYDYAQHHGDTGHAAFDIALLPDQSPTLASARLESAIEHHTDAYVRSRALSGTKLATLTMTTGDPSEATAIAHRSLDEIGLLRSQRAATDVRDLANAAIKHARRPEVAELHARIRTVLA